MLNYIYSLLLLHYFQRNACCSDEQNFPFKFIESSMMLDLKKRVTNVDNGWIIRTDPFPCQVCFVMQVQHLFYHTILPMIINDTIANVI